MMINRSMAGAGPRSKIFCSSNRPPLSSWRKTIAPLPLFCTPPLQQASWQREDHWIRGVPYQIFGGTEFYERAEIKDLLAYLKTIVNPRDQESMLRIINVPRRGISDNTLDLLTQENRLRKIPLWDLLKEVAASQALHD